MSIRRYTRLARRNFASVNESWSRCARCMSTSHHPAIDQNSTTTSSADKPELQPFSRVLPMDPASNIKLVEYTLAPDASPARRKIEARRVRVQKEWIRFWTLHNHDYAQKLEALKARYPPKGDVPSNELTAFFKEHVAATRADHRRFNAWWLSENFGMLAASIRCWFQERIPERKEPGFFGSH